MHKLLPWCAGLAVVLGCYPDSGKIRNSKVVGTGGADGGFAPDAVAGTTGDAGPVALDLPGVEGGPLLPPGAAADNCTDFGFAWCEKARQCQTGDIESLGGASVCPTRMKIWCENILVAPADTGWGKPEFKTCITSWTALTCDEWRDFELEILKGPSCFVPGKRGDGAGCWSFAQCGGGECFGEAACGRCKPRVAADGPCDSDSVCARGLVCGQQKCVVPMSMGGACSDSRPCRRSLLCRGGVCGPRAGLGESCVNHEDCAGGLLCNFTKDTCGVAMVSATRCSSDEADGSVVSCAGGSSCERTTMMCVANVADNQTCVPDSKPDCLWPAFCASNNTCRIARPVDCPAIPATTDGGS